MKVYGNKTIYALHVLTNYFLVKSYYTKRVKNSPKIHVLNLYLGRASAHCAFSTMSNIEDHLQASSYNPCKFQVSIRLVSEKLRGQNDLQKFSKSSNLKQGVTS